MATRKKESKGPVCTAHGVDLTNFNCGQCRIDAEVANREPQPAPADDPERPDDGPADES